MNELTLKETTLKVETKEERDELLKALNQMEFKKEYPKSIDEVEGKLFYLCYSGAVDVTTINKENHSSSRKREEQLKAFRQLLELRDAYNEIDGGKEFEFNGGNYCIINYAGETYKILSTARFKVLHFRKRSTRDLFLDRFRDLIEQCKELI